MASTTYLDIAAAVAALQARTDAAGDPVTDVSGEELRLYAAMFSPGVVQANAYKVVPGAGLSVDVGDDPQGDLAVVAGTQPGQGNYLVRIGGGAPENIALNAAHLSNPRIDQIYIAISDDAYDAGGITMARLALRTGDPAAAPAAPGPDPSWTAYLLLASVTVGAGVTSVDPSAITDERVGMGLLSGAVPVGTMIDYLGSVAPAGWLMAQGQAVSRTTYAALFAVVGTTYGVGDGSTTFNLPDLRRRMTIGKADSGAASVLGQTGGAFDHVHAGPSHTHVAPSHTHSGPAHTHSGPNHTHGLPSATSNTSLAHTHELGGSTGSAGSHSHSAGSSSSNHTAGSFISAAVSVPQTSHSHSIGSSGSHAHGLPANTGSTSSSTNHNHGIGGSTGSGGTGTTGTGGTGATGSAGASNTSSSGTGDTGAANPPYIVVNKLVKV